MLVMQNNTESEASTWGSGNITLASVYLALEDRSDSYFVDDNLARVSVPTVIQFPDAVPTPTSLFSSPHQPPLSHRFTVLVTSVFHQVQNTLGVFTQLFSGH